MLGAERSVWIATANLKELMVADHRLRPGVRRGRRRFRSVLEGLSELAEAGVELRILHSSHPSRPFRRSFDALPALVSGGIELRKCARVHFKLVVVDARVAYLGSANWTGAGLGIRGEHKRNFEMGIVTEDDVILDAVQASFHRVWSGEPCRQCQVRDSCEMPLSELP